jgi:hypothetical protein
MVPAKWTDSVADTLPGAARHTIQAATHAIEMCVFVLMARQTLKRMQPAFLDASYFY